MLFRTKDGLELPRDTKAQVTLFQGKQKKGTIDVWWLYDDGGNAFSRFTISFFNGINDRS